MKYHEGCLFDGHRCPLHEEDLEVDGSLCGACVDTRAIKGLSKGQLVMQLLMLYPNDLEEAKKAYERILRCVEEW